MDMIFWVELCDSLTVSEFITKAGQYELRNIWLPEIIDWMSLFFIFFKVPFNDSH